MFCAVYEFDVLPGKENEFKVLWHTATLEVKSHNEGVGSRLHKVVGKENQWIAYAQWPSREKWLGHAQLIFNSEQPPQWVKALQATINSVTVLWELDMVDDLLLDATLSPHLGKK